MDLIINFIIFIILLIIYVRYKLTFWKRQGIPNDITHSYRMLQNVMSLHDMNCIQAKGKIVGTYELLTPTLLIAEPKLINKILVEDFKMFSEHRKYALQQNPFGMCLFQMPYKSWKPLKSLMQQIFSEFSLRKVNHLFQDSTELFMKNIAKFGETEETFDIRLYFEAFVLDMILRAFFATNTDSANEPKNQLVMNSRKIYMKDISLGQIFAVLSPKFADWFGCRVFDKEATDFMTEISQRIINERKNSNKTYNDLLQKLIEIRNDSENTMIKFDDKQIIDNCILFLIAGFDTTAATLTNLAYYLVKNPSVQENIINELDEKLTDKDFYDLENMKNLVYMKACIDECLRIEPTAVRVERKAFSDCKLGNIFVPKDTHITIPVKAVHRDPKKFENPDEFRPERFLPENKHLIKSGTYLGFADGPRNCIGMRFALMEIICVLAKFFKNYRLYESNQTMLEYYKGQALAMPKTMFVRIEKRLEKLTIN